MYGTVHCALHVQIADSDIVDMSERCAELCILAVDGYIQCVAVSLEGAMPCNTVQQSYGLGDGGGDVGG